MRLSTAVLAALGILSWGAAQAAPVSCDAFMKSLSGGLSDMQPQFTRSLVVSRGAAGAQVFDLSTTVSVEGVLQCRNDRLERFETKIAVPANARVTGHFNRVQLAAIRAATAWQPAHAAAALKEMEADVADYLRASKERGDVYIAGKTEYHQGGANFGLLWSETERTLIVLND